MTALADPASGVALVQREAARGGGAPGRGDVRRSPGGSGDVTLQTVWPTSAAAAAPEVDGEGSAANDASVVLLVEVRGVRLLLTGDVEPPAQGALERLLAGVEVDVLKVPHHGSRHQDLDFLLGGCEPGWPWCRSAPTTTTGTRPPTCSRRSPRPAAQVRRTDLDGDVLVTVHDGALGVRARG